MSSAVSALTSASLSTSTDPEVVEFTDRNVKTWAIPYSEVDSNIKNMLDPAVRTSAALIWARLMILVQNSDQTSGNGHMLDFVVRNNTDNSAEIVFARFPEPFLISDAFKEIISQIKAWRHQQYVPVIMSCTFHKVYLVPNTEPIHLSSMSTAVVNDHHTLRKALVINIVPVSKVKLRPARTIPPRPVKIARRFGVPFLGPNGIKISQLNLSSFTSSKSSSSSSSSFSSFKKNSGSVGCGNTFVDEILSPLVNVDAVKLSSDLVSVTGKVDARLISKLRAFYDFASKCFFEWNGELKFEPQVDVGGAMHVRYTAKGLWNSITLEDYAIVEAVDPYLVYNLLFTQCDDAVNGVLELNILRTANSHHTSSSSTTKGGSAAASAGMKRSSAFTFSEEEPDSEKLAEMYDYFQEQTKRAKSS